jgi:hypothetical protein
MLALPIATAVLNVLGRDGRMWTGLQATLDAKIRDLAHSEAHAVTNTVFCQESQKAAKIIAQAYTDEWANLLHKQRLVRAEQEGIPFVIDPAGAPGLVAPPLHSVNESHCSVTKRISSARKTSWHNPRSKCVRTWTGRHGLCAAPTPLARAVIRRESVRTRFTACACTRRANVQHNCMACPASQRARVHLRRFVQMRIRKERQTLEDEEQHRITKMVKPTCHKDRHCRRCVRSEWLCVPVAVRADHRP